MARYWFHAVVARSVRKASRLRRNAANHPPVISVATPAAVTARLNSDDMPASVATTNAPVNVATPARTVCCASVGLPASRNANPAPVTAIHSHSRAVAGREKSSSPASGPRKKIGCPVRKNTTTRTSGIHGQRRAADRAGAVIGAVSRQIP